MAKIENNNFKKPKRTEKNSSQNTSEENSSINSIFNKNALKKESKIYFILAICFIVVVFGSLGLYIYIFIKEDIQQPVTKEKTLIEKQTEALEALNRNAEPLTEKEIKEQSEALEKADIKSLTEEDIQRQTEALENLR